jgi:glycosyltransferase involved in cell wall biosynthesis
VNILFVQHGDYAEAHERMTQGEAETYRDQFLSVAHVAGLADAGHQVTTVAICGARYDRALGPGLRAIGLPKGALDATYVRALFDRLSPDRIVCRTPHPALLAEARRRGIATLPCLADIFGRASLRALLFRFRLRRGLSGPNVPCVANHSLNASRSVVTAGLAAADRVVPWDWSRVVPAPAAKSAVADPAAPRLFLAGKLVAEKGVGDAIASLTHLPGARLSIAGQGDIAGWQAEAARLGVADRVAFLGRVANTEVRAAMAAHDIVLVPSRRSYPEGLPNTIYEALASRSALIMSDHPAFAGRVAEGAACLVHRAGDPADLAHTVTRLCTEAGLYARLSAAAPAALERLYIGLEWPDLVTRFLTDPENRTDWVKAHSLAGLGLAR